jgi:hypothetical protein
MRGSDITHSAVAVAQEFIFLRHALALRGGHSGNIESVERAERNRNYRRKCWR